jgi:hypothetical protein
VNFGDFVKILVWIFCGVGDVVYFCGVKLKILNYGSNSNSDSNVCYLNWAYDICFYQG